MMCDSATIFIAVTLGGALAGSPVAMKAVTSRLNGKDGS
jgi:hypothetical protein